jgi:class 3 adenylate cyclase
MPTLVIHPSRDRLLSAEHAQYMVDRLPRAKLVALDTADHLIWFSDAIGPLTAAIEEFLLGDLAVNDSDSVLVTVLVVDVAGADAVRSARTAIEQARGKLVVSPAGRGVVATFDGPARAVRCAAALVERLTAEGVAIRAGLHSGECVFDRECLRGRTVDVAAQLAITAVPGEVLVSQTVTDLVTATDVAFRERDATHYADGETAWPLYEASLR